MKIEEELSYKFTIKLTMPKTAFIEDMPRLRSLAPTDPTNNDLAIIAFNEMLKDEFSSEHEASAQNVGYEQKIEKWVLEIK